MLPDGETFSNITKSMEGDGEYIKVISDPFGNFVGGDDKDDK